MKWIYIYISLTMCLYDNTYILINVLYIHTSFTVNPLHNAALCLSNSLVQTREKEREKKKKEKNKRKTYVHVFSLPLCVVSPFCTRLSRAYLRPTIIKFFFLILLLYLYLVCYIKQAYVLYA